VCCAALCSHVHARTRERRIRTIPVDDVPDGKQLSSRQRASTARPRARVCAYICMCAMCILCARGIKSSSREHCALHEKRWIVWTVIICASRYYFENFENLFTILKARLGNSRTRRAVNLLYPIACGSADGK